MSAIITDDEVWELIGIALDSLRFEPRNDGLSAFKLDYATREKLALTVCERNKTRLPIRLSSRLSFESSE